MRNYFSTSIKVYKSGPTISSYTFIYPLTLATKTLNETVYYINDFDANFVVLFDKNWNFIKTVVMNQPRDTLRIGNFLYELRVDKILKYDTDFNILASTASDSNKRRLGYVPTCNCLYVTDIGNKINMLNLDLSSKGNIDFNLLIPYGLAFYNGYVYTGNDMSSISVLQNTTIIKTYTYICQTSDDFVSSILTDYEGYMAVSCNYDQRIYLFHTNGTYMNQYISTLGFAYLVRFDNDGRLVISYTGPGGLYIIELN